MISCVILSKNDGRKIIPTLESVMWCDEVIVIDDDSADNTRDVVRKYTDKIYTRSLGGDFSAQRNFGLKKARYEWILFVDSDEVIPPELKKEILMEIKKFPGKVSGYYLKRNDNFQGKFLKHGETAGVRLLRLGKAGSGKWVRPVHEVWQVRGATGILNNPILHYPHPDVAHFLSDINKYSGINAEFLHRRGEKAHWYHIIIYPVGKFFLNYFWKFGFLDGISGLIFALMMSFHSFLVRGKLYLYSKNPGPRG